MTWLYLAPDVVLNQGVRRYLQRQLLISSPMARYRAPALIHATAAFA